MFYLINGTTLQALRPGLGRGDVRRFSPSADRLDSGQFQDHFGTGGSSRSTLGADFNGDGVADLLVVSPINSPTGSGNHGSWRAL